MTVQSDSKLEKMTWKDWCKPLFIIDRTNYCSPHIYSNRNLMNKIPREKKMPKGYEDTKSIKITRKHT